MRTTIDGAGRVVIPKALRDALGLSAGRELELTLRDGRLEIEPAPTQVRLERRGSGLVAVPEEPLPPLTAEQVRDTVERTRR
jgi:AbrB family looped-hinge helix DNA binding protein